MDESYYYDIDELIRLVEEVFGILKAQTPEELSQTRFDAALDAAGHTGAPRARRIARRFQMQWGDLVELGLGGTNVRESLQKKLGEPEREMDDLDVIYAVRLVAQRLGKTTVSGVVYERERKKLLAADQRKHFHSSGLRLPSKGQILRHCKNWDAVLSLADLGSTPSSTRASAPAWQVIAGSFLVHGELLSRPDYEVFKRVNDIRAPEAKKIGWTATQAEARRWLKDECGLELPTDPPKRKKPRYSEKVEWPPDFPFTYPKRTHSTYTRQELLDWWYRFRRQKRGLIPATLEGYEAWAAEQEGAPHKSSFEKRDLTLGTLNAYVDGRLAAERQAPEAAA